MRPFALWLALWLALGLSALWAQDTPAPDAAETAGGAAAQLAPEPGAEDTADTQTVRVPSGALSELARALCNRLGENGSLPEWGRVALSRGERPRLSAADMFVLLTRAAQVWYGERRLPASVSLAMGAADPPILDPQDYPNPKVNLEQGRTISADSLLSFAAETRRWVDESGRIPTAVWVGGERLSAAEYMAGLAICLDYVASTGRLGTTVFLPDYSPPLSWAQHTELVAGSGDTSRAASASAMTPPLLDLKAAAPPPAQPELSLLPAPGAVHGVVDLVANYSGPPVSFLTFSIDGRARAIMNCRPYGYRWDTAEVAPGKHQVTVRAYGEEGVEVTSGIATYVVGPPKTQQAPTPPKRKS